MPTVFITGASSGIGKETAKLFQSKGWQVIATMRQPEKEQLLNTLLNVKVLPCDVTSSQSIKAAVQDGITHFGKIDVLVNNAGFYTVGIFEGASEEEIKRQLDTNLLGLIQMTKEVLPYFRKQKSGVIINISSIAGVLSVPLQTLYHAAKWGVEGFSESLQYELRQFNINVKLIEPGVIATDFYNRSMTITTNADEAYQAYTKKVLPNLLGNGEQGSSPAETAQTIYQAATDHSRKMRYLTGKSKELVYLRRFLPVRVYQLFTQTFMQA
ncbi:MAG: SDR family oxidoreductase [Lachnospiraceae bacterium]